MHPAVDWSTASKVSGKPLQYKYYRTLLPRNSILKRLLWYFNSKSFDILALVLDMRSADSLKFPSQRVMVLISLVMALSYSEVMTLPQGYESPLA